MGKSVAEQIASLQQTRDQLMDALAADSASPQPSQNFDGQVVDYDKFRRETLKRIQEINEMICLLQPFEITTVQQ